MVRSAHLIGCCLAFCIASPACGGEDFSSGSGGSAGAGSGSGATAAGGASAGGAGGAPVSGTCPAAPANGLSCTSEGLVCTYGTGPRPCQRTVWKCGAGAFAQINQPCAADTTCPPAIVGNTSCSVAKICPAAGALCGCNIQISKWSCVNTPPGCPDTIPNAGTSCAGAKAQDCSYGKCGVTDEEVRARCVSDVWIWERKC
ncbi:MAG TPA: hypothetical protein PKD61_10370 [Polyangiaceae bacterium]|nr:hypothetical protein [Polyangiaceae bacterium]